MIRSGLPKGIVTLHPFVPDQNILHRIVKRMPHMKLPRDIRRRHHNRKRFFAFVRFRAEIAVFFPLLIESFFNSLWIVRFCQFFAHFSFSFKKTPGNYGLHSFQGRICARYHLACGSISSRRISFICNGMTRAGLRKTLCSACQFKSYLPYTVHKPPFSR